jgi:hypothetical protein
MLRTNTPFERPFASHSLLIPWQTSPYALYKGVLCYPPPLKVAEVGQAREDNQIKNARAKLLSFWAKPLLTNRESLPNCQGNEDGLRFWLCGEMVLSLWQRGYYS